MRVKIENQIKEFRTLWMEGNIVNMIDQPKLPHKFEVYYSPNHKKTAEAIKKIFL